MTNSPQQRYVHQQKLGAGAMGEVWLAEDTLLNRPVALKYLKASTSSFHKEYFLSEARSLARLQHPNIVLIYDAVFDEQAQQFYLVMEYVAGESLADFIRDFSGRLPLDVALKVAIDVAQALQYAHERDIVHRDVKPGNVMIYRELVKLTDFGLADLISSLSEGTDDSVGTLEYMPPEQIQGEPIDGRADLYSLGVMLFKMVTGRVPFELDDVAGSIIEAHMFETPPSPKESTPNLPVALEYVILKLLAKDPNDRYPSAAELLNVLNSLQARQQASQSHLNLLDPTDRPLTGRADELQQLKTIWSRVRESCTPQVVILSGEMGLGKTRLAAEFIGQTIVDGGFKAVAGRTDGFDLPYDPFGEIVATILNREMIPSVPQRHLDQLLRQIPDLARLLHLSSATTQPQIQDTGQVHWQFYAAVLSIFTQLSPVVVFIEDATTLDEASFDLMRFLLGREQLPVLFIANCRPTNGATAWFEALSPPQKTVVKLAPLSPELTRQYLIEWIGGSVPEGAVDLIQKRSRGNPLQIEAVANQLLEKGVLYQDQTGQWGYSSDEKAKPVSSALLSRSITDFFGERLAQLSEESREGLTLAALLKDGYEFDLDTWLELLGGEAQRDIAHRILDEGLAKRIIHQVDDELYAFRPVEMGKALLSDLSEEQRRSLHLIIADTLAGGQNSPVLISHHYEQADLTAEAAGLLQTAGDEALANYAVDAAIDYYNRAVELVESRPMYETLGRLYQQTGRGQAALDNYQRALALAEQAGDTAGQANILNNMSFILWMLRDQYKEAYQRAATVLKLSGAPEIERAIARSHLGMISWLMGRLEEAERWCLEAVEYLKEQDDRGHLASAYNRLGLVYFSRGELDRAETVFQNSLELRRAVDNVWGQAYCLNNLGKVALDRGDFQQSLSLFQSAFQLFEKVDSQDGRMVIFTNRGRVMLYRGRPEQALPWLTKALHLAQQVGKQAAFGLSEIYLLIAQASLQLDAIERAEAAGRDALKIVNAAGNQEYIAVAEATLAEIYSVQQDDPAAEAAFERALKLFKQIGALPGMLRTQLNYAQYVARQGDSSTAAALEEEARAQAKKLGLYLPPVERKRGASA